jgi:sulfhydrogenase subunit gamma (sulfur reductase)
MNLYQPHLVRIEQIVEETIDTRTLKLAFEDAAVAEQFDFRAGQFGEYSVFGAGECTFCIASPPTRRGYIEASFKAVGKVTRAMRRLNVGDMMGFRGPYGNHFPLDEMKGKNVLFIAGGIGLAPVRCVIWNTLDLRDQFKDVTIIYGARSVADLVYKCELDDWASRPDVKLYQCVDPGGETAEWKGEVCFVPALVEKVAPSSQDSYAVVCGPPIVITLTLPLLERMGFAPDRIYTTLENRMKCGLGKCGRCNVGPVYVCKDGPVFTSAQLKTLPPEY